MSTARRRQAARRCPKGLQLETLFGQERTFCYSIPPVFLLNSSSRIGIEEEKEGEEKWRFQADMLKAECRYLRMEREISARRAEKERDFVETTLKSSIQALIAATRKIEQGEDARSVLEEEIQMMKRRLSELQNASFKKHTRRDPELLQKNTTAVHSTSSSFDHGETLLQKQLNRIGGFSTGNNYSSKDFREIAKASLLKVGAEIQENPSNEQCSSLADVEVLRRKMEGLSKGKLLMKMEEHYVQEENICAGHCKALVRRIMEQVRAETEQWSQMQEMLGQVREEMEELQASRNFWEDQALHSYSKIKSLTKTVQEWKQKAGFLEAKEKDLEEAVKVLEERVAPRLLVQEKESRALTCRVKGNCRVNENGAIAREGSREGKRVMRKGGSKLASPSRLPFMDVGNLSPLVRQKSRRSVFPLQSPQH